MTNQQGAHVHQRRDVIFLHESDVLISVQCDDSKVVDNGREFFVDEACSGAQETSKVLLPTCSCTSSAHASLHRVHKDRR